MGKLIDLTGERFGKLVVVCQIQERKNGCVQWFCKCDCGNKHIVISADLNRGSTKSCGCLVYENSVVSNLKHGYYKTKTYSVWLNMVSRCNWSEHPQYCHYGGRGIEVCNRWQEPKGQGFLNFLEDMGEKPEGLTLDRIDNDGNYESNNCRWVTQAIQTRNKRNNIIITIDGVTKCLREWCDVFNVIYSTAQCRYHNGWSINDIFEIEE